MWEGDAAPLLEAIRRLAVTALRAALTKLLAANLSERELARLWLRQAGAAYDPRDEEIEMSGWFAQILDITRGRDGDRVSRQVHDHPYES
ncbi:hypothetical protein OG866_24420 [Streptomyces sp. NBC_00663]|uniref:hypothetical protein n=1 Tax=Streptomyces sp. NBC_00663 TaxID=2975801 RepID=UPI002E377478|nr:hypothetical protein [Streptomyces sp. NBC_00663]